MTPNAKDSLAVSNLSLAHLHTPPSFCLLNIRYGTGLNMKRTYFDKSTNCISNFTLTKFDRRPLLLGFSFNPFYNSFSRLTRFFYLNLDFSTKTNEWFFFMKYFIAAMMDRWLSSNWNLMEIRWGSILFISFSIGNYNRAVFILCPSDVQCCRIMGMIWLKNSVIFQ